MSDTAVRIGNDKPIDDSEQRATGYHEASHSIIGILLGGSPGTVSVRCEYGAWVGEASVAWSEAAGPCRKQKTFQLVVAGPLGQLKHRACLRWGNVLFDKNDTLEDIVRIIRQADLSEDARVLLDFIGPGGSKETLEVRDFNDIDELTLLQELVDEFQDEDLLRLLSVVRTHLDSPPVWTAVGELADSLCRNEVVPGHDIVGLARRHGLI